jgi:NAD(P)-dependent dehydrogenase (short-subunit alcohol dehydrogenase family)
VKLRGAAVLLTGASGGIGRAVAARLGAAGTRVALFGRREAALRDAAEQVIRGGGESLVVAGDVRRVDDAARAVREATERFGRLDGLVNLAGVAHWRLIEESTEEDIREQIEVNLLGVFWMTRAALPALFASRGAVVNVSSFAGRVGIPYYTAYAATLAQWILEGRWFSRLRRPYADAGIPVRLAPADPGGHVTTDGRHVRGGQPSALSSTVVG